MTNSITGAIIGAASSKTTASTHNLERIKPTKNKPVSTYAGRAWVSSQMAKNKPIY